MVVLLNLNIKYQSIADYPSWNWLACTLTRYHCCWPCPMQELHGKMSRNHVKTALNNNMFNYLYLVFCINDRGNLGFNNPDLAHFNFVSFLFVCSLLLIIQLKKQVTKDTQSKSCSYYTQTIPDVICLLKHGLFLLCLILCPIFCSFLFASNWSLRWTIFNIFFQVFLLWIAE